MFNLPALSTALPNDELIVIVVSLGDFKTSLCCFVYDRLALQSLTKTERENL